MLKNIPDIIGNAKTLFIAETDGLFDLVERDGRKVEIVFIAVCQYDPDEGFYLFGCDKDFNTHTDYYYDDLEEALDDAKRVYNLKQIHWRQWFSTMDIADTEEIYISLIYGVQTWFPAKAKSLSDNQFLILNFNEFDCSDYSSLPEFIPGDTVLVEQRKFDDGDIKNIAVSLVKPSPNPDKYFFEFLYYSTQSKLTADTKTFDKYRNEIERIKIEFSAGRYFNPAVLETIDKLDKKTSTT